MQSTDHSVPPLDPDRDLEVARRHAREGRLIEAEAGFQRVIETRPGHAEALHFLGNAAFRRGDHGKSIALLSNATKADPGNGGLLTELGIVYHAAERLDAARYVLERAVSMDAGREAYRRLLLADVLELDRRPELALLHYCRAMVEANQTRRWTSAPVDAAELRARVDHAQRFIAKGRREWFDRALQSLRTQEPAARWDRIDAMLAVHLGERAPAPVPAERRQGPLSMPAIASSRFLDHIAASWLDGATGMLASLGSEVQACIALTPAARTMAAPTQQVTVLDRGIEQYEARRAAPGMLAALAGLPLARIRNIAPQVAIVVLAGRARIPVHHGLANSRCQALVNLAGGAALEVVVGDEKRVVGPGESTIFDPGFGVAYANPGSAPVRAIVFELWHPDLAEVERAAVSALFVAALDFDTRMQELP